MYDEQYLIYQIQTFTGKKLDNLASGMIRDLVRLEGETDDSFRKRILKWLHS